MILLDGEKVAAARLKKLRRVVLKLKRAPQLAIVLAGKNEASEVYVRQKQRAGKSVGITVSLYRDRHPTATSLCRVLARLGQDARIDGIIVQLPLPNSVATDTVFAALPREKDVDGLVGESRFVAPTPAGILALLDGYRISVVGKRVVIWGRGGLVGKPLAALLVERGAWVTCVHRGTRNPGQVSAQADIVIAATGVARLIRASLVKKGVVVIDAGWSRQGGKIVGDVDFIAVSKKASAITPVPGGVGPMTVAMLMENVVRAARGRKIRN